MILDHLLDGERGIVCRMDLTCARTNYPRGRNFGFTSRRVFQPNLNWRRALSSIEWVHYAQLFGKPLPCHHRPSSLAPH
jgi:hypothetical protein